MTDNNISAASLCKQTNGVYIFLITLEAASIGIKYQGQSTNPFQELQPIILLFLTAIFCHAITLITSKLGCQIVIIFHVSGVLGCETLLWILVAQFWWWYAIINVVPLLIVLLCLYHKKICEFLRNLLSACAHWILLLLEASNMVDDHIKDLEAQER
ncbi:hypothetical protein AHAS_Ahas11G0045200 [Arachis hypogaea]